MIRSNTLEIDGKTLIGLKLVLLVRSPFWGTGLMSAHLSSLGNPFIVLLELNMSANTVQLS